MIQYVEQFIFFEYKKNKIPDDGSRNNIGEFWITFSKGKYNQIFLKNAWTHRAVYKEFLLKFDNGFLIYLYNEISNLENYQITKSHWIKNLNELKKILIQPNSYKNPVQPKIIPKTKIYTFFQYSVDEIKRKLSNYNNRKKNFVGTRN